MEHLTQLVGSQGLHIAYLNATLISSESGKSYIMHYCVKSSMLIVVRLQVGGCGRAPICAVCSHSSL